MSGGATARRWISIAAALAIVATACGGGGDSDGGSSQGTIQGDTVVVDEDQLAAARAELEAEQEGDEPEIASAAETDLEELSDDGGSGDEGDGEDEIAVAEAEEDELDGLLNAVTIFNQCLDDEGYEFVGAPGQDGVNPDDFEQGYLQALGACAAESNIVESLQAFGEAQANLTPEEIAENNFGLPVFKECMEDLGWTVGELIPDERGALTFGGDGGAGLTPPDGQEALDLDDVNTCRLEAENYVAENYVAEEATEG
ncbi:MAG: hypothetical protein AAF480_12235 [Actinomycetota bacterium]